MKLRGLVLAALVLSILAGVLYWSEHRKLAGESMGLSANASPEILKLDEGAITQITVKKKGAEPVTLVKANNGNWRITEPRPLSADQDPVLSMLSTLSSLDSQRVVDARPTDLKQYGLDPPSVEVDITEKDHKTQRLLLGDDTPVSGTAYTMLVGNPAVYTTSSFNRTNLDRSLNELRDKRLLEVSSDSIHQVELIRKAQDIEFSHGKDGWQIVKPEPLRADGFTVDDFVRKLAGASMDPSATGNPDPATAFAHGTPVATAKVTTGSGTEVLQVRQNKDTYYAKSSVVDGVYKVDSDLGQALGKNLDDFRSKQVFGFGFNDPNKLELHSGSKAYSFTRNGKDWLSNGKKMDTGSVESLVSNLRDLTAAKFLNSGFTKPVIEVTVTSDDGKQVQTVLIAKSGSGYLAKCQQEPSLYQLDTSAVDGLQKAADAVKPAGTPGK